jgi:hypothetical protein
LLGRDVFQNLCCVAATYTPKKGGSPMFRLGLCRAAPVLAVKVGWAVARV